MNYSSAAWLSIAAAAASSASAVNDRCRERQVPGYHPVPHTLRNDVQLVDLDKSLLRCQQLANRLSPQMLPVGKRTELSGNAGPWIRNCF